MTLVLISMVLRVCLYTFVGLLSLRREAWGLFALAIISMAGLVAATTPDPFDNHLVASFYAPVFALVAWRRLK